MNDKNKTWTMVIIGVLAIVAIIVVVRYFWPIVIIGLLVIGGAYIWINRDKLGFTKKQ